MHIVCKSSYLYHSEDLLKKLKVLRFFDLEKHKPGIFMYKYSITYSKQHRTKTKTQPNVGRIGVVVRMSILDTKVDGSIPASICFLLEQETLSALLQSTQL